MGAYDLGELGPAAIVSGGLSGLLEAYKMKMSAAQDEAKTRQSGLNEGMQRQAATVARQEAATRALDSLKLRQDSLVERKRAAAVREGQGEVAINPITGENVAIPKGVRFVTPPGAADAQKNVRTAENLLNILEIQERKMASLPRGRAYGRGAVLMNKLTGMNPHVGVFQGIHEATIPVFSRVIGGDVGNLAEQEQIRAAKINPSLVQTPEEMAGVLSFTKEILKKKLEQNRKMMRGGMYTGIDPTEVGPAPAAADGLDPVDEFGAP